VTNTVTDTAVRPRTGARVGDNAARPDGIPKVRGEFAFTGDMWADGMLWGRTVRATHSRARIRRVDVSPALAIPGVIAVLTADDVPGRACYGLDQQDQPVFARDVVRYFGEPVAAVAAEHPETARRAAEAVVIDYEPTDATIDPEAAITGTPLHPMGNVIRHLVIRTGDPDATGPVVVEGTYQVGMQDQAFMGPEAGLAIPAGDGGVDLYISTQWLHSDRDQVAACLGLPCSQVRLFLGGVGGAFGAREDVSLQVHACLLALRTGRPVKMVYSREESFLGHVHRHPARLWYRHTADTDGCLVKVEARILLDGGAYASTSYHVLANAVCFSTGPYRVPNAFIDGWAVRTNNPPCGAMRGFGAVQVCFGHEAQMDKVAEACGLDPVEVRLRNALGHGDRMITGQAIEGTLPVAGVIRKMAALPLPEPIGAEPMAWPGGAGRTADVVNIRRGFGVAVGYKNLMYAEGFRDTASATCILEDGWVTLKCAAAEVGQGFVTVAQQIARTVLTVDNVSLAGPDTSTGSAGSTSASRQTWMSGGAIEAACRAVRDRLLGHVARSRGVPRDGLTLMEGRVVGPGVDVAVEEAAPGVRFEEEAESEHRLTHPLDHNGQGNAHVSFVCAAHRAVVDVDPDLGLIRVVQIATAQDVGRALNPLHVVGQIEGGIAQGVGLATMEELLLDQGRIRNPSFTDYLIPTALDMPDVVAVLVEEPEPGAPFGAKGVGEPPTISSSAAILAAIRNATGRPVTRAPVRPEDIAMDH
jgi:xanthine dehydrogenase D subunit